LPTEADKTKAITVFYASESDGLYPDQKRHYDYVQTHFDITMTYHLESDPIIQRQRNLGRNWTHIPVTYVPSPMDSFFGPIMKERRTDALASIFVSNCGHTSSGRNEVLQRLQQLNITIHFFGACFHNKDPADVGCALLSPREVKRCVIRQYRYYLSFENSIDDSYVTEKYFQALEAGVVPVYLGAPNIDKFDPLDEEEAKKGPSYLVIKDLNDVERAAKEMIEVASNETLYSSYLRWRFREPSERLKKMIYNSLDLPLIACDLCHAIENLIESRKNNNTLTISENKHKQ